MNGFLRHALISVPIQGGGLLLTLLTAILVARVLGAEAYGAYVYAMVLASFASLAISLGLEQLAVREVPRLTAEGAGNHVIPYAITLAVVVCVMTASVWAGLEGLAAIGVISATVPIPVIAGAALGQTAAVAAASLARSVHWVLAPQILTSLVRPTLFLAVIGLLVWIGPGIDATTAALVMALSGGAVAFVLSRLFLRTAPGAGPMSRRGLPLRRWFTLSLPLILVSGSYFLNANIDVLMIEAFLGESEVGIYRAAARGAQLAGLIVPILDQVLPPRLSRALAEGSEREVQRLLGSSAAIVACIGTLAVIILWWRAEFFLGLFGPAFTDASTAMRILLIGQVSIALVGSVGMLLVLRDRGRMLLVFTLCGTVLNCILNAFLLPRFGIEGAAAATTITLVAVNVALLAYARARLRLDSSILAIGALLRR